MMICNSCGKDIGKANVKFCPYCGGRTDISQGTESASAKKDDAPETSNGKSPLNKTVIIVAIIIAVAAVVIVLLILNQNGLHRPDTDRNTTGLVNSGDAEGPSTAGLNIESVGDIIEFGNWHGEPIEWRVLNIEHDRALLISKDILTVRQYYEFEEYGTFSNIDWDNASVTWADSDIRSWLNEVFINDVFSNKEQKSILLSEILNSNKNEKGIDGGRDTEDKVFLLSVDEADRFFENDDDRIAEFVMTEDDINYILRTMETFSESDEEQLAGKEQWLREEYLNIKQGYWWWLRSPGYESFIPTFVDFEGLVYENGSKNFIGYPSGVRPAMWVNNS